MKLQRTPLTWAMYGANGAWASFVYLSGPVSPVVSESLGVPVSLAGLVGTALAGGLASASVTAPAAIRAFGRHRAALVAMLVIVAGLALTMIVPPLLGGYPGYIALLVLVLLVSAAGGTTMNTTTAVLSQTHPDHSAEVITEANAAAGWVGLLSPLLLGLALGAGLGWRAGIAFSMLATIAAIVGLLAADRAARHGGVQEPEVVMSARDAEAAFEQSPEAALSGAEMAAAAERAEHPHSSIGGLPKVFWVAMVALFAAAATEFAINFWGSTLIQEQTGAPAATATAVMSASVAGIAIGRTVGSAITARFGSHPVLLAGFGLALFGFAILWSSGVLALSILGLLLAGLGLATLFPLILDRSIVLSGGQPDLAMSRVSLVLGLAIGGAPFALGALGAVMPVQTAMLLVPVFVIAGIVGVARSKPPASHKQANA